MICSQFAMNCLRTIAAGAFLLSSLWLPFVAMGDEPVHCYIIAPRALGHALVVLQDDLPFTVTYEDPEWIGNAGTEFLAPGLRIPQHSVIMFTLDPDKSKKRVIEDLVACYNRTAVPFEYKLYETETLPPAFNARPVQARNGNDGIPAPLLDTRISYSVQDESVGRILRDVCNLVSTAAGQRKLCGPFPERAEWLNRKMTISGKDKKAIEYLNEIASSCMLSWQAHSGPASVNDWTILQVFARKEAHGELSPVVLSIEDSRPLATAVQIIEREFGCAITYEDPLYVCGCEILSRDGVAYSLRGGLLKHGFSLKDGVERVLADCVTEYSRGGNPARFAFLRRADAIHVVPIAHRNQDSKFVGYASILEGDISFGFRGAARAGLEELCKALSVGTGQRVLLGEIPDVPQLTMSVSFDLQQYNARDCLTLFTQAISIERIFSWQLWYEPYKGGYTVNINEVGGALLFSKGIPDVPSAEHGVPHANP